MLWFINIYFIYGFASLLIFNYGNILLDSCRLKGQALLIQEIDSGDLIDHKRYQYTQ